jgi:hypothetical protein
MPPRHLVVLLAAVFATSARPVKLSPSAFANANAFIDSTGRPLERALKSYHFAHGSRDAVIAALATYQNTDGGFATNLESDARWRGSSPMATMLALRLFNEVDAPESDAHVRQAVRYLLATFDSAAGYWHALPKGVNTAPHAPWWEVHDSTGKCDVESPVFPTAALAGYLRRYDRLLPAGFLDRITVSSLRYLDAAPIRMSEPDIQMLTELTRFLPAEKAVRKLRAVLAATVEHDPNKWTAYTIQPLAFVPGPRSSFYAGLEKEVSTNLDYMIAHQDADGGWPLTWSWEKEYPAAWAIAKREWRAQVALEDLERLAAFDRLETEVRR